MKNIKPLHGSQLAMVTLALSLATFMNTLDTTIANVSIPVIAGSMGASNNEGTWIITSFSASTAIMLPLSGWLAKRFGEVRLFVIATLLFTIISVLCGLATNLSSIVFFRILQGIAAGPMIPISQSLLLNIYPPGRRGLATGFWAMSSAVAPVLGPILGGYITDSYSWPWIFFINVPVGLFCVYVTWIILRDRETKIVKTPVDYIGLILLAIGIGSLQVLLDQGRILDWFNSPFIVILTIVSTICLIFLVIWVLGEEHPIVDLSLFRKLNFAIGTTAVGLGFMTYFSSVVILPLWLQSQLGYTPTWAGLVTAPVGILPIFLSPVVGQLTEKMDLRLIATMGFGVFSICSFWLSGFNTMTTASHIAFIRLIQGLAIPCFLISMIGIALSQISTQNFANAAGLSNFTRVIGASFGTSIFVTIWDRRESFHQSTLAQGLTNYNAQMQATVHSLNNLGLNNQTSYALIAKNLINQAYMLATNDVFWLHGIIFAILLFIIWFAQPPFAAKGTAAVID